MGNANAQNVSVVILTLNAENNIAALIKTLHQQTIIPKEIIVLDSESTDRTTALAKELGARVLNVERREFNHGGTRDFGMRQSSGKFVLFLTHDAVPANERMISELVSMLDSDASMAAVYGRQVPREDATYMERIVRLQNYPEQSHVYCKKDIPAHGIRTFFMSDVCALYRKTVYDALGGFETDIRTNEDMIFSANAIRHGYSIGYAAQAQVFHSHNLSMAEQYRRNFAQGYEIERHRELLLADSQNSAGMKLVKNVSKRMFLDGRFLSWVRFGFDCCARYAGSYMGKRKARKL